VTAPLVLPEAWLPRQSVIRDGKHTLIKPQRSVFILPPVERDPLAYRTVGIPLSLTKNDRSIDKQLRRWTEQVGDRGLTGQEGEEL
jgi:hypothetical protein